METERKDRRTSPWEREFIRFCEASPEGRSMLEKVAKSTSTKVNYSIGCKHLSDFLKKDLTRIVDEYKADVRKSQYEAFDKWEHLFDDFIVYLEKLDYKSASVKVFHAGAKALINANVPRSLRLQAKGPKVVSRKIKCNPFDELKQIYDMCGVREKAFIAILKDSGISADDVISLNIEDLEGLQKGESWIHVWVFRGKEGVEYETFLGPNAVEALKAYLNLRRQKGEDITPKSPIFATERKPYKRLGRRSLSTLFTRITKKTGIRTSTHRLRKFFETYMALTVRHPIVLKYWMGHQITTGRDIEARYIIPPTPEQLALYKEAYKNIDLIGGAMEERLRTIEEIMAAIPPEQREKMRKAGITMMRKKENIRSDEENVEDCPDGENCGEEFRQIGEAELLSYLRQGWQIVHRLRRGEVIVKR